MSGLDDFSGLFEDKKEMKDKKNLKDSKDLKDLKMDKDKDEKDKDKMKDKYKSSKDKDKDYKDYKDKEKFKQKDKLKEKEKDDKGLKSLKGEKDKVIKGMDKKKKKKTKSARVTWQTYIHKVLKTVHDDDCRLSHQAMSILDSFANDLFERISTEAVRLLRMNNKKTLTSMEIQTASRLVLPGELCKHAIQDGAKAVSKYQMQDGA